MKVASVIVAVVAAVMALAALGSARGFIRNWLRQHLDLRVTPDLDFRPDRSMQHAARIQELLKQLDADR